VDRYYGPIADYQAQRLPVGLIEPSVEPDLAAMAVQAGDCFVVCSDGLSNYLSSDELGQVLTGHFYRDVANVFVDLANDRGGDDNVTCLVVYAGNEK